LSFTPAAIPGHVREARGFVEQRGQALELGRLQDLVGEGVLSTADVLQVRLDLVADGFRVHDEILVAPGERDIELLPRFDGRDEALPEELAELVPVLQLLHRYLLDQPVVVVHLDPARHDRHDIVLVRGGLRLRVVLLDGARVGPVHLAVVHLLEGVDPVVDRVGFREAENAQYGLAFLLLRREGKIARDDERENEQHADEQRDSLHVFLLRTFIDILDL
jgi:hypothetical protein